MQRAHGVDRPAEGVELGGFLLAPLVVGLVGDYEDGHRCPAQELDGLEIRGRRAGGRVHHEDDEVRLGDGQPRLLLHLRLDVVGRVRLQPARIDHDEAARVPLGFPVQPVTGRSGAVLDDGGAAAEDPVEEGALADVGAADDGDDGEAVHGRSSPRGQAAPAVGTARLRGRLRDPVRETPRETPPEPPRETLGETLVVR